MKLFAKSFLIIIFIHWQHASLAQEIASTYRPKNLTEKLITTRVKGLPEIKDWLKTKLIDKKAKPDMLFNIPDPTSKSTNPTDQYFTVQVGENFSDIFRTHYWLSVNPKTMDIYYVDFLDESGMKSITLQQWRYWRTKPVFSSIHKWEDGKLVASDIQKKHKKR